MGDALQQPESQTADSGAQTSPLPMLASVDSLFPQPEYRPGAPLCFIHIAKTAGTSVRLTVENAFDGERVFPSGSSIFGGGYIDAARAAAAGDDFSRFESASGHQGALILERMLPDTNSFIWFRDPMDRLMSSFFFAVVQRSAQPLNDLQARAASEPLEVVFMDWLRNIPDNFSLYAGHITGVSRRTLPEWQERNPGVSLQSRALEVVRRSFFVGMVEDYDRAMDYFCALTGILPPRQQIRRNVGSKRHLGLSLDAAQQRELQRRLAPDVAFCAILREIYLRQMQLTEERVDRHPLLRLVGQRDALRAALLERHAADPRWHLGTWTAWDAALAENLDGRERDSNDNKTRWRWTGPSKDTLLYFNCRGDSDLRLDLDLYAATPHANAAAARLYVDGHEVRLSLTSGNVSGRRLSGIIPAALLPAEPRLLEFRLVTPVMVDEADLKPIASRKLGLALQRIAVTPIAPRPHGVLGSLLQRLSAR